ncbi:mechanosensitive ion channel family protein [Halieaceae bacterium IMCC11814]|uniref:Mechanosensitive ion channel family protein n=2 Tax=Candidatus Marimicrobium litorale TaxID=2518991 RepID=A0ABT3T7R9_9GAMM|nr:mechanosensitive ion channel family protein [Candidatus Marimicrobium litorale]
MIEALSQYHEMTPALVYIAGLLIVAWLAYLFASRVLLTVVRALASRTQHTWDDALVKNKVGARLAQLVPAVVINMGVQIMPGISESLEKLAMNLASAYMIVIVTITLVAALNALNDIYEANPEARKRPIKGFVQLLQLALMILGALLFIASLLDQSPVILLSGFGAMTAVLLLIFKDTLLSLVASVQLTAQDLVRVGDWIEVPQFGADGDVVDVELHTVRVQNWDKTITTIPTHRLISDSFKNWRGMSVSGGRRIKRALNLDASSIHFLSDEEITRCKRFALLTDYLTDKEGELDQHNSKILASGPAEIDPGVNRRRLTNIGTFRAYVWQYLRQHPQIRQDMTLLVRPLPPGAEGVPIEIYCFTSTTEWAAYEDIQADIFDHVLAIVEEFGLRLFQQPAGTDFSKNACKPVA